MMTHFNDVTLCHTVFISASIFSRSFLNTEIMALLVEIIPFGIRTDLFCTVNTMLIDIFNKGQCHVNPYHGCWWPGDIRSQGISSQCWPRYPRISLFQHQKGWWSAKTIPSKKNWIVTINLVRQVPVMCLENDNMKYGITVVRQFQWKTISGISPKFLVFQEILSNHFSPHLQSPPFYTTQSITEEASPAISSNHVDVLEFTAGEAFQYMMQGCSSRPAPPKVIRSRASLDSQIGRIVRSRKVSKLPDWVSELP